MQPIDHIEVRYRRADTVGAWSTFIIRNGQSTGQIAGIQRGMTYQVEARSIARNGAASIWTSQTHTVSDTTLLPIAPTGLAALSVADGVHLTWTISGTQRADVEYDVQRTSDVGGVPNAAGWVNITSVKATAYTDGLTDGVARWYRVRAVDFQSLASAFSNSVLSQNKSVADGADKTLDQPIVYTGLSSNLITNGNFIRGNTDDWYFPDPSIVAKAAGFALGIKTVGGGAFSPAFNTAPGHKYRFEITAACTASGPNNIINRVCMGSTYSPTIPATSFADLFSGSFSGTLTTFIYEWVCPADVYYCSLAVYNTSGTNAIFYSRFAARDYGASDEWGANKTENNTAANTDAVGTVPASDVVNTINAGGGVDFLNPGNTNQGDLSKINQANTTNIVANAVNSKVSFSSTVLVNIPRNTITIVAQQTITTNGGYVKIRAMMEIFAFSSTTYANPQIIIRKGNVAGTQIAFYGNVFVPLSPGGGAVIAIEAVDDSPLPSQQYTVTAFSSASDMQCDSISFVIENAKV